MFINEIKTKCRNSCIRFAYKSFLKPLFFLIDPEKIHDRMISTGNFLSKFYLTRLSVSLLFGYKNANLSQNIFGINFDNPIGLAAGFDKNAELVDIIPSVGFGFMEVGSITGNRCEGNPKPRLWRLKESRALIVNYGLKNNGCEVISSKLRNRKFKFPIGTSIAMTNCEENLDTEKAIKDYEKAFKSFSDIGDYFTVNISCPNSQGGQPFVQSEKLESLLSCLDKISTAKPIFLKLSPDVDFSGIDLILDVAKKHNVHGIICTNLTKNRNNKEIVESKIVDVGGISGKPTQELSDKLLSYIYAREKNRFVLVGCGGVFSAEDAYRKIRLGASLVELITGMIYEGPQLISEINRKLEKLVLKDGFKNIKEAIGADVRM